MSTTYFPEAVHAFKMLAEQKENARLAAEAALNDLKSRASGGDGSACAELANNLYYGYGVTRDKRAALKWYKKGALAGNNACAMSMGAIYHCGDNVVEPDYAESFKWYKLAADRGDARGHHEVAEHYFRGEGVEPNLAEALKWYQSAAALGCSSACYILGHIYANTYVTPEGPAVPKDDAQAEQWKQRGLALDQAREQAEARLAEVRRWTPKPPPKESELHPLLCHITDWQRRITAAGQQVLRNLQAGERVERLTREWPSMFGVEPVVEGVDFWGEPGNDGLFWARPNLVFAAQVHGNVHIARQPISISSAKIARRGEAEKDIAALIWKDVPASEQLLIVLQFFERYLQQSEHAGALNPDRSSSSIRKLLPRLASGRFQLSIAKDGSIEVR